MRRLVIILSLLLAAPLLGAEVPDRVRFTVSETAGLRRFGYPVTARLPLRIGAVREAVHLLLEGTNGPVKGVQYDERGRWPDGSLKEVDVSFNTSPGPLEAAEYKLRFGPNVTHPDPGASSVQETADAFTLRGVYRIPRHQREFLDSIRYGAKEFLHTPAVWTAYTPQGLAPIAADGRQSRILARGAINGVVELSGHFQGKQGALPFTLTVASPNSKSWFDATMEIEDPRKELTSVGLALGYKIDEAPALYDFGVGSWVYGTLKDRQAALLLSGEKGWRIVTGTGAALNTVYAASTPAQPRFEGWGHLLDGAQGGRAIAFGSPDFLAGMEGSVRIQADGSVAMLWNFQSEAKHRVRALFHHVGDPVHVTAVTSPAAMLHPLIVKVLPEEQQ